MANSGLIVHPDFRNQGLAKKIKKAIFELSRDKFPNAKIFGITTGLAVMKMNYELGYKPVTFSELTTDPDFWKGCQTCKNFDILTRTEQKNVPLYGNVVRPRYQKIQNKKIEWKSLSTIKANEAKSFPQKEIKMKKLVLAYSGGLDTSYCAKYFVQGKRI